MRVRVVGDLGENLVLFENKHCKSSLAVVVAAFLGQYLQNILSTACARLMHDSSANECTPSKKARDLSEQGLSSFHCNLTSFQHSFCTTKKFSLLKKQQKTSALQSKQSTY